MAVRPAKVGLADACFGSGEFPDFLNDRSTVIRRGEIRESEFGKEKRPDTTPASFTTTLGFSVGALLPTRKV